MRQDHIKFLVSTIDDIDNNPIDSMKFYNGPLPQSHINQKTKDDAKGLLIGHILHDYEHHIQNTQDCGIVDPQVTQILSKLNIFYLNHQHLCWPSHSHHFHTNFGEYLNCPITCLAEISEFLKKLGREMFQQ
jgi:hypothetical protein